VTRPEIDLHQGSTECWVLGGNVGVETRGVVNVNKMSKMAELHNKLWFSDDHIAVRTHDYNPIANRITVRIEEKPNDPNIGVYDIVVFFADGSSYDMHFDAENPKRVNDDNLKTPSPRKSAVVEDIKVTRIRDAATVPQAE
jgi:hypothetical protein